MSSIKEVVLEYNCPVCRYTTKEVHEKITDKLYIKGGEVETYAFKSFITGIRRFERFQLGTMHFIICPQCGTVLDAMKCGKETNSTG